MWAYKRRACIRRGGGGGGVGGLINGIKKRFETSHGSVDRNTFLSLKVTINNHLALFSTVPVIQQKGAYIRRAYKRMYFFLFLGT